MLTVTGRGLIASLFPLRLKLNCLRFCHIRSFCVDRAESGSSECLGSYPLALTRLRETRTCSQVTPGTSETSLDDLHPPEAMPSLLAIGHYDI